MGRPWTPDAMSGRVPRRLSVLGEERLLERRLAAHEIDEVVSRGLPNDRRDRARHPHPQDVALGGDLAHARQRCERGFGNLASETDLDLVMGEIAERLDAIDSGQATVADDRHAVTGPLDLAEDVTRKEDRSSFRLCLADDAVERLLDERVQPRRRLVEHQQVRAMLQRDHQADLLLVALRVFLELPTGVY